MDASFRVPLGESQIAHRNDVANLNSNAASGSDCRRAVVGLRHDGAADPGRAVNLAAD